MPALAESIRDPDPAKAVPSEYPGPVLDVKNGVSAATADWEPLYTLVNPSVCSKFTLFAVGERCPISLANTRCSHSTPRIDAATCAK